MCSLSNACHPRTALENRPHVPGLKFVIPKPEQLALGSLAGGRTQNPLENEPAGFLDTGLAIDDHTAIDIHVLLHGAVHLGITGELDRGHRLLP